MIVIGLTYDLKRDYDGLGLSPEQLAEFDDDVVIDTIEATLAGRGFRPRRIGNILALTARLAAGERWPLVFNIAEGRHGLAREAQVPALLEAFEIPFVFSDALATAVTLDKSLAKHVVASHGLATPAFTVIERMEEVARVGLPFPLFVKPLAEGTGKGISAASLCGTPEELAACASGLLATSGGPLLVERFLPGREFTVGITGTGAGARPIGVMEVVPRCTDRPFVYSYEVKADYLARVDYLLAEDDEARRAAALAVAAYRALRCRDGGRVDLRSDEYGNPQFLEINPLAGLHPVHSDLVILSRLAGWTFEDLLMRIVTSALERHGLTPSSGFQRPAGLWSGVSGDEGP